MSRRAVLPGGARFSRSQEKAKAVSWTGVGHRSGVEALLLLVKESSPVPQR